MLFHFDFEDVLKMHLNHQYRFIRTLFIYFNYVEFYKYFKSFFTCVRSLFYDMLFYVNKFNCLRFESFDCVGEYEMKLVWRKHSTRNYIKNMEGFFSLSQWRPDSSFLCILFICINLFFSKLIVKFTTCGNWSKGIEGCKKLFLQFWRQFIRYFITHSYSFWCVLIRRFENHELCNFNLFRNSHFGDGWLSFISIFKSIL